ncbi:hypothetical protein AQUCO_01300887v1 [Aquilegia coerulea]|uniref:CASP-like protein n=1 Tax=Aquilegia coerulea TaxID=218851 RepID=A0A2G5E4H2_AQUCA|nr:hypothetical protein AQUCO_01300887v1 [Aquilegia coerulea]
MDKSNKAAHQTRSAMMSSEQENTGGNSSSSVKTAETLLRIVPMALCVSAMVVMLKNSQTNDYGSVSYSDLGGFRYLVYANGICAGYSFLSAFHTARTRTSNVSTMPIAWAYFFFDQVMTYAVLAAGAVSTEVVYLAYKGDTAISWSESCGEYGGFCKKATVSVIITFVTMACYVVLSLISSYRLFSKYDAPIISYSNKNVEIPAFSG